MRRMHTTKTRTRTKFLLLAAAAGTLAVGASSVASATTEPPGDTTEMATDVSAAPAPPVTAGEPSSPEAEAFCEAELGIEAATSSEDPAAVGPAIEAAMAAATDDVRPLLETVVAAFEATGGEGPEFDAAYGALIAWMQENCGFAQLNVTLSEFAFGGIPEELPAGGTIVSAVNTGEQVHEIVVFRLNDDMTMTVEELFALPEEELFPNLTFAGAGFAVPGEIGSAVLNLTPGRYVAICFLPDGLTPEIFEQAGGQNGPDVSYPPGVELGAPHFVHGMLQEFTVV